MRGSAACWPVDWMICIVSIVANYAPTDSGPHCIREGILEREGEGKHLNRFPL